MGKFCPKCGKIINSGLFCDGCNPETIDFKPISIKLSPSGKVFIQGKWTNFNNLRTLSEWLVKKFVKQKVILNEGLEVYEELLEKAGLKKDCELIIESNGKVFKVPINVEITLSPDVAKVGSTYFEGILQLRNARPDVKEYIKNYASKHKVFINKVVEKDKDVDYFFVRKRQLQPLALKLMRNFGATLDNNAQLFSRNRLTSRDIFRVNVLVSIPDFTLGDVVEVEDHPFFVKETNKIVTGINLITGKKSTFRNEDASDVKVLRKYKSKIMTVRPELQVMDQESYQLIDLKNPLNIETSQDQNIVFVKHKNIAYLIK
ncbi:MAG: NMD3-related protein [Candidatus Woesearchaeota archaeon]|jgi:NMD protein affecting ribosome stability and mRNA decay